ncbi:MAG TPA: NAD(P)/FAD-dependent oxidoreductase [Hyphomicrobiaceae bacterium]
MRIVIVGAGVAGCILTRSLSRLRGAEVVCLERARAGGEHVDFGTGLSIGPNGVKALRAHDPALAEAVAASSFPWRGWKVSLTDGTPLLDLPLASVADTEGWRVRWSEFYRVLREAAAPAITYGCTITHVAPCECDAEKTCIEWLQDGAEKRLDDVDLLVATDGRCSQVRWTVSGAPAPRHVGVAISRVLVPDTSGGLIDDYEQWFNGPNRLLCFRVPPAHVHAACTLPIPPDEPIPEALKRPEAIRELYVPPRGKLSAPAQWTLDALCARAANLQWARMQWHCLRYADPDWNVLYLGDAAHGMVPTLGQGATQAIEDATVAGDIIAQEWASGRRNPRQWLRRITHARADRVHFAMRLSLEAADTMLDGADPVAGTLQKLEPGFLAKLRALYCDVAGSAAPAGFRELAAGGLMA